MDDFNTWLQTVKNGLEKFTDGQQIEAANSLYEFVQERMDNKLKSAEAELEQIKLSITKFKK